MAGWAKAGRRPRDRRQQILAAAAERFRASGYHNVGMTEIADAVGVAGPAMYRHVGGPSTHSIDTRATPMKK